MLTHNKLLRLLLYSGYEINISGMCYGVAMMGIQAILADDLKSFRERIAYLGSIENESKLPSIIQAAEEKRLDLLHSTQSNPKYLQQSRKLINKTLDASIPPEHKIILNIKAFFDGISLYFFPYLYPQVFPPNTQLLPKNPKRTYLITAPEIIAREEKNTPQLTEISAFIGAYTEKDLNEYFSLMEKEFSTLKKSVTLLLKNGNHAISIGYLPKKGWVLIDANNLTLANKELKTTEIGRAVLQALSKNDTAIFSTEIFDKSNSEDTLLAFTRIKSTSAWENLHDLSKKLDYQDSNHFSQLYIAAQHGYVNELKSLIENKANVNAETKSTSALYAAVESNRLETADFLLKNRANINRTEAGNITPLYIASQLGHVEMVNRLLEEKNIGVIPISADVTVLSKAAEKINRTEELNELYRKKMITEKPIPGFNALHAACFFGHPEIVKSLLIHGVDPHQGKITALEYATAMGHQEIINMIADFTKINELSHQLKKSLVSYQSYKDQPAWLALNNAVDGLTKQLKENDSKTVLENLITMIKVISSIPESQHIQTKSWFGFLNQSTLKEDLEKLTSSFKKYEKKPPF